MIIIDKNTRSNKFEIFFLLIFLTVFFLAEIYLKVILFIKMAFYPQNKNGFNLISKIKIKIKNGFNPMVEKILKNIWKSYLSSTVLD